MADARVSGPDVVTVARGLLALATGSAAVVLGTSGRTGDEAARVGIVAALVLASLADGVDGWWARRIGVASARGARLDTAADLALAAAMLAAVVALIAAPPLWLWLACGGIVALRAATLAATWMRWRRLGFAHTLGNKAAGLGAAIAVLTAIAMGRVEPWTAGIACAVAALAAADEFAYATRTREYNPDAKGCWRA